MAKQSPTQKAKRLLERLGYTVAIVERWNPYAGPIDPKTKQPRGIRQDMLGFIDLIGFKDDACPIYLQVTSWTNVTGRVMKIVKDCQDQAIPLCGSRSAQVEVWGFKPGRVPKTLQDMKRVRMRIDRDQVAVVPDPPVTLHSSDLR